MTPDFLTLVLLGLATHEALDLWFNGSFFQRLRVALGKLHPVVREGVNCPTCIAVWLGAAVYALSVFPVTRPAVWVLAAVDLAGAIHSLAQRK